ncbi:uncharacterized protein B0P05DRAFT_561119 [Gilbertella persicaria]|uniref:uncharacterized protein n=1 Tax=Gilbertella persicaria TaxID=101096 RepID=UPI00221FEA27|nr:uncharacterized protein B0P05DRAFT_561119 [Gilbertella persicaria]KAI8054159.1 hypothetical protein B0P05DRAFT_561119 [Gilbertella persicaria]
MPMTNTFTISQHGIELQDPLNATMESKKPLPQVPNSNRNSTLVVGPSWTTVTGNKITDSVDLVESPRPIQDPIFQDKNRTMDPSMVIPNQLYYPYHVYEQPYYYYPVQQSDYTPMYGYHPSWQAPAHQHLQGTNIQRSDSLKIETAPAPLRNKVQHLEKPDEPSALQRKVSKEEIDQESPIASLLLQKLNTLVIKSVDQDRSLEPLKVPSTSTITTPSPSSSEEQQMSNITLTDSHPSRVLEPMTEKPTGHGQDEDPTISFSAAEKYFDQPSAGSTGVPSPWGTKRSSGKHQINRISTGSVPTVSVFTARVPDEISEQLKETPAVVKQQEEQQKIIANQDEFLQSLKHKPLSIASYSLIQIRSNIKLYRRMAFKTKNKDTQMTYAKYLLQISKLYDKSLRSYSYDDESVSSQNKKDMYETPVQTRYRLLKEAGFWIERLSKSGYPEALYIQGRWYLLGCKKAHDCVLQGYERPNESKALKCFQSASKGGWVEAHYELAQLWKKRRQFAKAIEYFEKGAKENHALSVYKMAKIFLRGQLKTSKDIPRGMAYLKQAADMDEIGCAEPAFVLGCVYANEFERIGIQSARDQKSIKEAKLKETVNYSLALQYLKKSAHYGYPDAMYFMGQVFEGGMLGQLCDIWQAYQCYMKAAEVHHPGAMLNLSRLYCQGIPGLLAAQKEAAFKWCKKSADLGFCQAEFVLG